MKQTTWIAAALGVAGALLGVEVVLLPSLQGAEHAVEADVAVRLERARRLLHAYQPFLAYNAAVLDGLPVEGDGGIDDLSDQAVDEYQERHGALWAAYQPTAWEEDPPRAVRPSYGGIEAQIRQGVAGREAFIKENDRLLAEARTAIDEALAVSSGDASGRSSAEANRLRAMIEFYGGVAERLPAAQLRAQAGEYQRKLAALAGEAIDLTGLRQSSETTEIDAEIARITGWLGEAQAALTERQNNLATLGERIAALRGRIDDARRRQDRARTHMERLREKGLDYALANPTAEFADRMAEQDRVFREAMREVQSLEAGSYPFARIDASADFLTGRYLENGSPVNLTIERGLRYYDDERVVAADAVARHRARIDDLRADAARLEAVRDAQRATHEDALRRLEELRPTVVQTFDELNRVDAEAFAVEESALRGLDRSARTSGEAARLVSRWIDSGRTATQGLAPEAMQRSAFQPRSDDEWMGGFIAAQGADAHLIRAWIFYDRFRSANRTVAVLDRLPESVRSAEIDVETERAKAVQARQAGMEEIQSAMRIVEGAHRDAERHWSLVAQGASTAYLLALFGDASFTNEAIEGYRSALKGREDQPYAQRLAARLRSLEKR